MSAGSEEPRASKCAQDWPVSEGLVMIEERVVREKAVRGKVVSKKIVSDKELRQLTMTMNERR